MLTMFHTREGDFKTALHYAKLGRALAETVEDATAIALAHSRLGRSLHLSGDHSGARAELEASFRTGPARPGPAMSISASITTFWSVLDWRGRCGYKAHPAQAAERMRQTIKDVERKGPYGVFTWSRFSGHQEFFFGWAISGAAEEHADRLISHGEPISWRPYLAVGRGYKGALAIRPGRRERWGRGVSQGLPGAAPCAALRDAQHGV